MESVGLKEYSPSNILVPWTVDWNQSHRPKAKKMIQSNSLPFYPLLVCMRFLGIELVPSSETGSSSKSDRCKTLTLGLFFLVANAFCNIYITLINSSVMTRNSRTRLYSSVNQSSSEEPNSTTRVSAVMSWNIIIDHVNFGVLVVVVHVTLLTFFQQEKWRLLWNNTQRIHQEFKVTWKTIHHLTIIGLAVVFLETIVIIAASVAFVETEPGASGLLPTLLPALLRLCPIFFYLYAGCGLLLFALVGWTALLGYRNLHEQVAMSSSWKCTSLTSSEQLTTLAKWKCLDVLLNDVVDGMDECFGPILLLWIVHIFVGFIAIPYYILDGFHHSMDTGAVFLAVNIFLIIQHAFHLLLMTGIPSGIQQQAMAIGKQLQLIEIQDSYQLQAEVNMLATQILISLPRITAMGYGNLDLPVIAAMIGATSTYLVILCQFEVSEEIY